MRVSFKAKDPKKILASFADGNTNVLVSCNMINEGFDVPEVDLAVFARLTESEIVFQQQLGRVLRRSQNVESVSILDLSLNLRRRWKRAREEIDDALLKKVSFVDVR